ncbi:MAG: hypothetical protein KDC95_14440 [Planctomycetes bacterium]|nr:hypothetical protein [Planctomycetota bacterium]
MTTNLVSDIMHTRSASIRSVLLSAVASLAISVACAGQTALSVRDFGARGDDNLPDSAAIQRAIRYCETLLDVPRGTDGFNKRNRCALYFPPGKYLIDETLRITNALDMFGDDASSTYLVHTGTGDLLRIVNFDDEDGRPDQLWDVSIRRLTLHGNKSPNSWASSTRFGIYMEHGLRGCKLQDLIILHCEIGAFLRRCYTANIVRCTIMFCYQNTLKWENATAGTIQGCRFDVVRDGGHCVFLTFDHANIGPETLGFQITGCSIQGSGLAGLYCRDVGDLTITSCFFENNNRLGRGYGALHLEDVSNQPVDLDERVLTVVGGFFTPGEFGRSNSRAISIEGTERVNLIGVDARGFEYGVEAKQGVGTLSMVGCNLRHTGPNLIHPSVQTLDLGSTKSIQAIGPGEKRTGFTGMRFQGVFGLKDAQAVGIGTYDNLPAIQGFGNDSSYRLALNPHDGVVMLGAVASRLKITNTNDTTSSRDHVFLVDTSGGARSLTLRSQDRQRGRRITVKKSSGDRNVLTIVPESSRIDGASSRALIEPYATLSLICDGTNWFVLAGDR